MLKSMTPDVAIGSAAVNAASAYGATYEPVKQELLNIAKLFGAQMSDVSNSVRYAHCAKRMQETKVEARFEVPCL